jgi:hypothetical protein
MHPSGLLKEQGFKLCLYEQKLSPEGCEFIIMTQSRSFEIDMTDKSKGIFQPFMHPLVHSGGLMGGKRKKKKSHRCCLIALLLKLLKLLRRVLA